MYLLKKSSCPSSSSPILPDYKFHPSIKLSIFVVNQSSSFLKILLNLSSRCSYPFVPLLSVLVGHTFFLESEFMVLCHFLWLREFHTEQKSSPAAYIVI
jgi:hypothetical protein